MMVKPLALEMEAGISPPCHRPLSRASRQLFRQDASSILLHYFGGKDRDAPWRRQLLNDGDASSSSSDSSIDPAVDNRGRRRERLSLVDNPDDGLTDQEWFNLLGWAIDQSISSKPDPENRAAPTICPLHPKHDMLLQNDKNSFLMQRRHRTGLLKFGAFSLPSGRAARTALWLEERETYRRLHSLAQVKTRQTSGNSVFLFQCGICGKTFVSRYYLDKHMESHHPTHVEKEVDSTGRHLLCPADHVCEALGGTSACVETMNQISPYYGRGMLLAKEYYPSTSDSLLSHSISSLISHLHRGDEDPTDLTGSTNDLQFTNKRRQMQKLQATKEADLTRVIGEMRQRAVKRNKLMLQVALHRQQAMDENPLGETRPVSEFFNEAAVEAEGNVENDLHPITASSICDEKEMERLFRLCRDMMHTCFGDSVVKDVEHGKGENKDSLNIDHALHLANDLITHICEPLHCYHRLHRMAGHNSRHALDWNDQWDEHHSFALGLYGWIVVLGVVTFYGCVFVAGARGAGFEKNGRQMDKRKNA